MGIFSKKNESKIPQKNDKNYKIKFHVYRREYKTYEVEYDFKLTP